MLPHTFKPFSLAAIGEDSNPTPIPRSGHRIVCNDYNMYLIGGYNPNYEYQPDYEHFPILTDLWQYSFLTEKWKRRTCTNFPIHVASCAILLTGKTLVVYGGTTHPFGGHNCSNKLFVCNLESADGVCNFQEISTTGDKPEPTYGHSIFLKDNYFYTVGGTSGYEYYINIYRLNLTSKVWECVYQQPDDQFEPQSRYRHEICVYNDGIYVFGGSNNHAVHGLKNIPVFSLISKSWTFKLTRGDGKFRRFPRARKYLSLVTDPKHPELVYITGGITIDSKLMNDCWRLNLTTMRWTNMISMSLNRGLYFHSSAITSTGRLIHFGGVRYKNSRQNNCRTNDLYSSWIRVPSLRDICSDIIASSYKRTYCHENLHCIFPPYLGIIW